MKKGDTFGCVASLIFHLAVLLATTAGCAAASTGGISGLKLDIGIDFKPVSQKVNFYGLRFFVKFLFHNKLETVYIKHLIIVFRLIQSHGQRWAASTAGVQKDSNRCHFLVFEIFLNLFSRFLGYFNHSISTLLEYYQLNARGLPDFAEIL